ncbi:MAG: cysteine--tRNA ligase, partial [Kordiimonadaceae bacterium]|nr:cysteine--tRNA ligase [Kordiimonadaceae bacterium]
SLGNFVTVHELLEEHGKNIGEAIRMCLLTAHYRQPVDFSSDGILQANKQLTKWYNLTQDVTATKPAEEILEALRNDLNTPKAIMELHQLAKDENRKGELLASAQLLGLLYRKFDSDLTVGVLEANAEYEAWLSEREEAKKNKDYATADKIRDRFKEHGITIKDTPDGPKLEFD